MRLANDGGEKEAHHPAEDRVGLVEQCKRRVELDDRTLVHHDHAIVKGLYQVRAVSILFDRDKGKSVQWWRGDVRCTAGFGRGTRPGSRVAQLHPFQRRSSW